MKYRSVEKRLHNAGWRFLHERKGHRVYVVPGTAERVSLSRDTLDDGDFRSHGKIRQLVKRAENARRTTRVRPVR